MSLDLFEVYRQAIVGLPLSLIWRGHGSAIFLEIGQLCPVQRNDGTDGNPVGEFTVMLDGSWRIESQTSILGGSWSDEQEWETHFKSVIGRTVHDIALFGRLPELSVALSGDRYFASFMTAEGQPAWALLRHSGDNSNFPSIAVKDGAVVADA